MKAAEARKLKVGDYVEASFAGYRKNAEILAIVWPRFTLKAKDYKGRDLVRRRRYESIFRVTSRPTQRPASPDWLTWKGS